MTDPQNQELRYPLITLRDIVVFPGTTIPLWVARAKSLRAIDHARAQKTGVFLLAQRQCETEDPGAAALYSVGTIGAIVGYAPIGNGTIKLLVEGLRRARVRRLDFGEDFNQTVVDLLDRQTGGEAELRQITETLFANTRRHEQEPQAAFQRRPPAETDGRVAAMQALLEAEIPSPAERLHALAKLLG